MISAISELHRKFVGLSLSFVLTNILANDSDDGVVILPPFIYEGPPQLVYFSPGDRLVLPCKGYGIPFPRFYWYHNGQPLETSNTTDALYYMQDPSINGVLHMKARPQTTQGYYHCLVVNNFGISMSNVTFLQEAVLQDLQLRRTVYNITVTEGRPLVLQCSHVISIPAATITWHTVDLSSSNPSLSMVPVRFNERIATDDNGGLVFLAITKTDVRDDLVYKCDAYNYIIRRTSGGSYYRIIVQEEPYKKDFVPELIFSSSKVIALTGTDVTLTCLFSSRPTAVIEWNRTGAPLPSTAMVSDYGRKLLLKQVALADAGYYRCTASNDVGDSSSSISLVVVASPRMRNPMSNRNVTVGQSASFDCDCVGQPKPSVQWLINAQPVNFSRTQLEWEIRDNILSLNDLQLGDDAIVACNASNNYGSVLSSAYLLVHPSLTTEATDVPTTDAANITFTTEFANAETSQVQTDSTTDVQTEPNDVTLHTMSTYSQTSSETESSVNYEMITTGMTTSETGSDNIFGFRAHNSDEVMNGDEVKSFKFNFISAICFLVFFLCFFLFLAFVCHKTANKRKTYRVNEQEKKHGCSKREYDSDDSGYDEQRAERIVNRFRTMMTIDQECYL